MKTPHRHAALIKEWADGAEIEVYSNSQKKWITLPNPAWEPGLYRVKTERVTFEQAKKAWDYRYDTGNLDIVRVYFDQGE